MVERLASCPPRRFGGRAGMPGAPLFFGRMKLEARVRIELTIEVLQTSALPLGYRAGYFTKTTR